MKLNHCDPLPMLKAREKWIEKKIRQMQAVLDEIRREIRNYGGK